MYVQCTSSQMEVCMEGDDVKGFIYVWDKRFRVRLFRLQCCLWLLKWGWFLTGWRFKLVGYPWPDEGRKVFFGEAGSGKSRSHWCIENGIYSWCDGSGLHSSESEIVNCSISVLLHWFGPLKYYSYMLLEQVFTLTVFTGDFVLIFKVVTSRMASWATKGSK